MRKSPKIRKPLKLQRNQVRSPIKSQQRKRKRPSQQMSLRKSPLPSLLKR
jgi:hypothetical protein